LIAAALPTVPAESLATIGELGRGLSGYVMEASCSGLPGAGSGLVTVAVKYFASRDAREAIQEAVQAQRLDHPNVIKMLACCPRDSAEAFVVYEYAANGDLKTYLRAGRSELQSGHLLQLARDAASGFAYLAGQRVVHRDLAARNVLLDSRFVAKISDFGGFVVVCVTACH
jgi:serine/threonine protein kinase